MHFNDVPKKLTFGHFCIFDLVKGHFGLLGPKNGPSSGQNATYQKTEDIQRYDPIESDPSSPKKETIEWKLEMSKIQIQMHLRKRKYEYTHITPGSNFNIHT